MCAGVCMHYAAVGSQTEWWQIENPSAISRERISLVLTRDAIFGKKGILLFVRSCSSTFLFEEQLFSSSSLLIFFFFFFLAVRPFYASWAEPRTRPYEIRIAYVRSSRTFLFDGLILFFYFASGCGYTGTKKILKKLLRFKREKTSQ